MVILEAPGWIAIKRGRYKKPLCQSSYAAEQAKAIEKRGAVPRPERG